MTDLAGAVQTAIFNALSAITGLPPVVSETPTDGKNKVLYPFVLLGDDQVTDHGTKTQRFERHEVAVHVCVQGKPKLTVRGMQELVRAALHDQPITAPGAVLSKPKALNSTTPLLDDGATYVGTTLFEIFAQDAT